MYLRMHMRGCIVCVCVVGLDELYGQKGSKDVEKQKEKKRVQDRYSEMDVCT